MSLDGSRVYASCMVGKLSCLVCSLGRTPSDVKGSSVVFMAPSSSGILSLCYPLPVISPCYLIPVACMYGASSCGIVRVLFLRCPCGLSLWYALLVVFLWSPLFVVFLWSPLPGVCPWLALPVASSPCIFPGISLSYPLPAISLWFHLHVVSLWYPYNILSI